MIVGGESMQEDQHITHADTQQQQQQEEEGSEMHMDEEVLRTGFGHAHINVPCFWNRN